LASLYEYANPNPIADMPNDRPVTFENLGSIPSIMHSSLVVRLDTTDDYYNEESFTAVGKRWYRHIVWEYNDMDDFECRLLAHWHQNRL